MERAELLCDREGNHGKRRSWVVLGILVGVVAPVLGVVPYLISLEGSQVFIVDGDRNRRRKGTPQSGGSDIQGVDMVSSFVQFCEFFSE